MRSPISNIAGALLVLAQACATSQNPPLSELQLDDTGAPRARSEHNVLRVDGVSVQGITALDVVREHRPEFLRVTNRRSNTRSAPPAPAVYENGRYLGSVDLLSTIPLAALLEIQRLDPVDARNQFGPSCPCDGGVLHVRTRR